jgi:hypothetical protein
VTDYAHDMNLLILFVDGVAHGLAAYGEAFVFLPLDCIPVLKRVIQAKGVDTDENFADDGLAGDNPSAVFIAAAETPPSFVSPHPAQRCPGGNGEHRT